MKNILLIACVTFAVVLNAGANDTIPFKRPYYIGLTTGYTGYFNGALSPNGPRDFNHNGPYSSQQAIWGTNYGVMLAVPFARKMEVEIAALGNFITERRTQVTSVTFHPDDPWTMVGISYNTRWHNGRTGSLRIGFSHEFFRKKKIALQAGLANWCVFMNKTVSSNTLGTEAVLKMYWQVSRNTAWQFAFGPGASSGGAYLTARVALLIVGTRYYNEVKSKKYYVRTYEEGE